MARTVSVLSHIQAWQSEGSRGAPVGQFEPPESPWLAATVSQPGKHWAVPNLALLLCLQLEQGQQRWLHVCLFPNPGLLL